MKTREEVLEFALVFPGVKAGKGRVDLAKYGL